MENVRQSKGPDREWRRGVAGAMFVISLLAAFSVAAATADERPPWQWTDEERMAARFDPEKIRERRDAYNKQQRERNPRYRATPPTDNVIDGTTNPELLLPWELFQTLVQRTLDDKSEARDHVRCMYAKRAAWLAGDPEFWSRLEAAAAPFLRAIDRSRERGRLARESGMPPPPDPTQDGCRSRLAALDAARAAFGPERFDEFLYTAVAPGPITFAGDDGPTASDLLRIARGCP